MIYQWKTGSRFKTDANIAAGIMNELAKENRLNAETLVDVSRPEDAPLHNEFEWDDAKAAEEWRKQTGRVMIASVVCKIENSVQQEPVRAYFHLEREEKEYTPIETIIKDSEKTDKLLQTALRELIAFQQKYRGIKEFNQLYMEIGKLEQMYIKPAFERKTIPVSQMTKTIRATN